MQDLSQNFTIKFFGIGAEHPMTLEDIGGQPGITPRAYLPNKVEGYYQASFTISRRVFEGLLSTIINNKLLIA